ncbi:MAG: polysaccharide biosynthesis protein [Acetatifactor sp.]|nr:polysaccharide biosynthesis protein [Acetatifactor sp.]
MSNKKGNSFIKQAAILGAAGLLVRVIGILYRSPLTSIISDEGNGYYSSAYNIYAIILLISSYSIPLAISKIISGKLALREYRNAHRVFISALLYVVVVGGIASLFAFIGAPFLVESNSVPALRVLAPTIFFSGLLGVLRGYFQAHSSMVQTSLSQILEQLVNAIVSVLAAWLLTRAYVGGAAAYQVPIRGAQGGAMGTGAGVLTGLIFMFLMYLLNRSFFQRRLQRDKTETLQSYPEIFKMILLMVTPVILSTFIYNSVTAIDSTLYYKIMMYFKGWAQEKTAVQYGVFATKYTTIINIPVALASSFSSAMIPGVSGSYEVGDLTTARSRINEAIRFTMILCFPAMVGIGVLAYPIMLLLFPQPETIALASNLLRVGCVCIIFYSLSTVTNAVLQGIGKVNIPMRNAALALVVHLAVLVPLLFFTNWNLYALLLGTAAYSLTMCVLNDLSVRKYLQYRLEVKKTLLLPALSAGIMGVVTWASYYGLRIAGLGNIISLGVSIVLSMLTYFVAILGTKTITEEELVRFPKGSVLIRLGKKLHLL